MRVELILSLNVRAESQLCRSFNPLFLNIPEQTGKQALFHYKAFH